MYVVLALVTGGFVAVMIELSGELQLMAGAIPALVIIHLSGLATSGTYTVGGLVGRVRGAGSRSHSARGATIAYSPWFLAAGVLGVFVVLMSNEVYSRGGVVLTLMGTLSGQTLTAFILERGRWFDGRSSPSLQKVVSLALILPGAVLIGFVDRVGVVWIFLSWTPGVVLMIQQMMNSRNSLRFGTRSMLLLNYITALTALAFVFAFSGSSFVTVSSAIENAPITVLLGGGVLGVVVTALAAFLLTRAPALQVTLGIYAGQITVGIVLDAVSARPFAPTNAIGIALVVLGLLAGWVTEKGKQTRLMR